MPNYLLRPKVPLLFRQGKPFGVGGRADTLAFPPPSTVAGALRRVLFETHKDYQQNPTRLLETACAAPLLVRSALDGQGNQILLPKPADTVYVPTENDQHISLGRLSPVPLTKGGMDLPDGLWPVFLSKGLKGKPCAGPPFWLLDTMLGWLAGHRQNPKSTYTLTELSQLGANALPSASRSHVAIDDKTFTAKPGQLFQTSMLDFGPRRQGAAWEPYEYALAAHFDQPLPDGFCSLGGKSGLTYLEECPHLWPSCPPFLRTALTHARGLRLILATPAEFQYGWRPAWLKNKNGSFTGTPPGCERLKLTLRAVALERWQAHSNWDMLAAKGVWPPVSPVRRLVPAGSVYWFEIAEGEAHEAAQLWLHPISDGAQARRDGFGLALPGVWNEDKLF